MKFVTKEDNNVVIDFQKHFGYQSMKGIVVICIVFVLIGIMFLLANMIPSGIFSITFSILFLIIYPLMLKNAHKKLNDSNKQMMEEKIVEYEFKEDKFSCKCYQNDEMINFSLYKYSQIFKIDETPKYFFIYVAINMALTIPKIDIDENEINEVRGLLQSNCSKYKLGKY